MSWKRLAQGFLAGVAGTIVMSVPMIVATVAGMAPMPEPIPMALVASVFGSGLPQPVLVLVAAGSHLGYGGFWAAVLAAFSRQVNVMKGLALGAGLWLLMQLAVLPYLGWGLFGAAVGPQIPVATLVLHLIYGGTTGYLLSKLARPDLSYTRRADFRRRLAHGPR